MQYRLNYEIDGSVIGVSRINDNGTETSATRGSPLWQEFLAWNATQPVPLDPSKPGPKARFLRTLLSIYTDLLTLTDGVNGQKAKVWADLSSGTPAKYLTDAGADADGIACLDWAVRFSGLGVAAVTDAKLRLAAIYCRDNPNYLVHPTFDPSINVLGDQPG